MEEKYIKLKQEIRALLKASVQSNSFEESENLYYDVAEISEEDSLEIAFDIIYKESEENHIYIDATFLDNVDERFFTHGTQTNIDSLKKRIADNNEKPAVNWYFQEMLDLKLKMI